MLAGNNSVQKIKLKITIGHFFSGQDTECGFGRLSVNFTCTISAHIQDKLASACVKASRSGLTSARSFWMFLCPYCSFYQVHTHSTRWNLIHSVSLTNWEQAAWDLPAGRSCLWSSYERRSTLHTFTPHTQIKQAYHNHSVFPEQDFTSTHIAIQTPGGVWQRFSGYEACVPRHVEGCERAAFICTKLAARADVGGRQAAGTSPLCLRRHEGKPARSVCHGQMNASTWVRPSHFSFFPLLIAANAIGLALRQLLRLLVYVWGLCCGLVTCCTEQCRTTIPHLFLPQYNTRQARKIAWTPAPPHATTYHLWLWSVQCWLLCSPAPSKGGKGSWGCKGGVTRAVCSRLGRRGKRPSARALSGWRSRGFLHSSSVNEWIALLSESRRMVQNDTHSLAVEVGQGPCCRRCISTPVSPHSPFHA